MRIVVLSVLGLPLVHIPVMGSSYQQTDGTIVDPIRHRSISMYQHGPIHSYSGPNLEPEADLIAVSLRNAQSFRADLHKANLTAAYLYESNSL